MSNTYDIELKMNIYDGDSSLKDIKQNRENFKLFCKKYLEDFDRIINNYDEEYQRQYGEKPPK
tara:strand:- start:272 stop:460 length:189 start_codon:yes stop_codon:yes gene_type:complete